MTTSTADAVAEAAAAAAALAAKFSSNPHQTQHHHHYHLPPPRPPTERIHDEMFRSKPRPPPPPPQPHSRQAKTPTHLPGRSMTRKRPSSEDQQPGHSPQRRPPPPPPLTPASTLTTTQEPAPMTIEKAILSPACGASDVKLKYEILEQIGSGTYGHVFRGRVRGSGKLVALKRIKNDDPRPEHQRDGFPITAIREIKILSCMCHENVIRLEDIVVSMEAEDPAPKSIFMVFEYCAGDLLDVLKSAREGRVRLTEDHLRCFTRQLLEGILYIHTNCIIHRDIKAANILVTTDCRIKIGDWGLSRSWTRNDRARYTDNVVTLWYRAPELLMGVSNYTTAVDIWSIGCLIAEMFLLRTLFQGRDELDQMKRIFDLCGSPPLAESHSRSAQAIILQHSPRPRRLIQELTKNPSFAGGTEGAALVDKLLCLEPKQRLSAREALQHDYLWTEVPKEPWELASLSFRRVGNRL